MSDKRAELKQQMEVFLEGAVTFAPSDTKGCFLNICSAIRKLEAITALSDAGEAEQGVDAIFIGHKCAEVEALTAQLAAVEAERDALKELVSICNTTAQQLRHSVDADRYPRIEMNGVKYVSVRRSDFDTLVANLDARISAALRPE